MEDIQLYIYIAFLLIAFLSRIWGKKKKAERDSPNEEHQPKEKPLSFEDLLKEFTQSKVERDRPEVRKVKEPIVEEIGREYDFKDSIPNDDEAKEIYQKSVRAAKAAKDYKPESADMKFGHFEAFEEEVSENSIADEVKEMLKDSNNMAKAVVLSEILNRKY